MPAPTRPFGVTETNRLEGVGDDLGDDAAAGAGEAIDDGVRHGRRPRSSLSQWARSLSSVGGCASTTTMAAALDEEEGVVFDQRMKKTATVEGEDELEVGGRLDGNIVSHCPAIIIIN